MTRRLVAAALTFLALVSARTAHAATIGLGPVQEGLIETTALRFDAAPGEANVVTVSLEAGSPGPLPGSVPNGVTIRDEGAVLTPGAGCSRIDSNTAHCSSYAFVIALGDAADTLVVDTSQLPATAVFFPPGVRVDGGDGDDRLVSGAPSSRMNGGAGNDVLIGGPGPAYSGRDFLDGGSGDDRIFGGSGEDELDGGPGRDELYGQEHDDLLLNADEEDDLLSGGSGADTVSHPGRLERVVADLGKRVARVGSVAPDRLRRIERLIGGSGDDRLFGDRGDNELDGGLGEDTLSGRGGNDQLLNSEGRVACGPGGADAVRGRVSSADILGRDCELVAAGHPLDEDIGEPLPAYPRPATARALTFTITCASTEEGRAHCGDGGLVVREARARRRRIAFRPLGSGPWEERRVKAILTSEGRRLASRPTGVMATVWIGEYPPYGPLRWTIRLEIAG